MSTPLLGNVIQDIEQSGQDNSAAIIQLDGRVTNVETVQTSIKDTQDTQGDSIESLEDTQDTHTMSLTTLSNAMTNQELRLNGHDDDILNLNTDLGTERDRIDALEGSQQFITQGGTGSTGYILPYKETESVIRAIGFATSDFNVVDLFKDDPTYSYIVNAGPVNDRITSIQDTIDIDLIPRLDSLEGLPDIGFGVGGPFGVVSGQGGTGGTGGTPDELVFNYANSDSVTLDVINGDLVADLTAATRSDIDASKAYVDFLQARGYSASSAADTLDAAVTSISGDGPVGTSIDNGAASLSFLKQAGGQSLLTSGGFSLRSAFVTSDLTSTLEPGDQWTLGVNPTGPVASSVTAQDGKWSDLEAAAGTGPTGIGQVISNSITSITGPTGPLSFVRSGSDVTISLTEQAGSGVSLIRDDAILRRIFLTSDMSSEYIGFDNQNWRLGLSSTGPQMTTITSDLAANSAAILAVDDKWSDLEAAAGTGPTGAGILIASAVQGVTGTAPISASRTDNDVTMSLVTQGGGQQSLVTSGTVRDLSASLDFAWTLPSDQLTLNLDASGPTVSGLDTRIASLETNTASLSQSGTTATLDTAGDVYFRESGANWMFYAQPNQALVFSPVAAIQSRGQHQFYNSVQPLSLLARFDGDADTITFQPGKTFTCSAAATFSSAATSAFSSSLRQGTYATTTSTSDTQYIHGGLTYREHVASVAFSYTFASAPRVYLNKSTQSSSILSVCATNVTATGFTLRALDVDAPTYLEVQWMAVL